MRGPTSFAELFSGRTDAHGVGRGGVIHETVTLQMYADHLKGIGADGGLGIFPICDDAVRFAAIDLDEPDFDLAVDLAELLPPGSGVWIEQSRSKGYHIWAFFGAPLEAWVARHVLRATTFNVKRSDIEIFPKQDQLRPGMVGNYINLPLFGDTRPIVWERDSPAAGSPLPINYFLDKATRAKADPDVWKKYATKSGGVPPGMRGQDVLFGERGKVHACADYIVDGALSGERPIEAGHRAAVYFNLAKMYLNTTEYTDRPEEVLFILEEINQRSPAPVPTHELERFVKNVKRGEWRSTGCDEALMAPYVEPDCPIASGL